MRRSLLVALAVMAACTTNGPSSSQSTPTSSPVSAPAAFTFEPQATASVVAGGCGTTKVYQGGVPASLDQAGGHNNPDGLPYVLADPPIAAGFIFSNPLKAGPQGDKILWVVGIPRARDALAIDAHPYGADHPVVYFNKDADSSPGEIYPTGLAVSSPGCWVLSLRWGTNRAEADLKYG